MRNVGHDSQTFGFFLNFDLWFLAKTGQFVTLKSSWEKNLHRMLAILQNIWELGSQSMQWQ